MAQVEGLDIFWVGYVPVVVFDEILANEVDRLGAKMPLLTTALM